MQDACLVTVVTIFEQRVLQIILGRRVHKVL